VLSPFHREAVTDEELWACSRLRAQCFYAYPPEREFAGKVQAGPSPSIFTYASGSFMIAAVLKAELVMQLHQITMAKEEFEALREVREARATSSAPAHAVCLMAVTASSNVPDASPLLRIEHADSSSNCSSGEPSSGGETAVGSLDLCNVRAVAGEILIGAFSADQPPSRNT
jgi:hypothetical protein